MPFAFAPLFTAGFLRCIEALCFEVTISMIHGNKSIFHATLKRSLCLLNGNGHGCGVMERTELQKRLEQLDLQVWDVTQEVARNQKVITQLDAVGMDTNDAQLLPSRLENLLIVLLQEREKLRAKLDGSSQGPPSSGHS
jgi:hypothetical protein